MAENEKKNSWDDLIQDLGAQPDESAFERKQPEPQEIPPSVEWSEQAEEPADIAPTPSDWGSLAESLGLEVKEEPEAADDVPAPTESPKAQKAASTPEKPAAAAQNDADTRGPDQQEVERTAEVDEFGGFLAPAVDDAAGKEAEIEEGGFEEVTSASDDELEDRLDDGDDDDTEEHNELPPLPTQMDQALSDTAWSDSADADDGDGTGISGEAARSAFDALFSDGSSAWGSAFLEKPKRENLPAAGQGRFFEDDDLADRSSSLDAIADTDTSSDGDSADGEDGERPKRKRPRRRRRGGRGRKSSNEATVEENALGENVADEQDNGEATADTGESSEDGETRKPRRRRSRRRSRSGEKSEATVEKSAVDDDDDELEDALGDDEGKEDDDNPRGSNRRQRHRNIPTWSEAIGMIVDANLEQRAKSPSKPQGSRGGRGRGGRRRGRKPEGK